MKNHISIDIPTKSYIKAYIIYLLGPEPVMTKKHWIGNKIFDILSHKTNERKSVYGSSRYNCKLRIYINMYTFLKRGANFNETNLMNFNLYMEKKVKHRFYELMDDRIEIFPNFSANLPEVRKKLGIDIDSWEDQSMQKDYYRYRKKNGKPPLYNSTGERDKKTGRFYKNGF